MSQNNRITHALPNWGIEGGFCNIGPLRRGLFLIFALQKSKKTFSFVSKHSVDIVSNPNLSKARNR